MKRGLAILLALVVLAAAAAAAFLSYRHQLMHNIRGSTTEFVPTEPKPTPPPAPSLSWEMFGVDPSRRAVATFAADLRPPFRRVWTSGVPSLVEFPPVIGYGRLFFADGAGRIFAISAKTGKRSWTFNARHGVAATPALGPYKHGTLYESFLNKLPSRTKNANEGVVIAVAVGSGKERWRAHIGASETSPLLVGNRLYVGAWNGKVYALDARTGRQLWTFQTHGAVKGGLAASGTQLFVGSYDGHIYSLRARTGKLIWRGSTESRFFHRGRFYATPVVAYGRVYVGSTDGGMYSFGATTGKTRWVHRTGSYVYGSAAVWHERVYVGSYDHYFYCFDAATGDVRWRFHANGPISGSATMIDGVVYFATLKGRTYALAARTGKQLWSYPRGKYAPAVSDGKHVFVTGYSAVYSMAPVRR